MICEWLFRLSALAWGAAGLLLFAALPDVAREGFGNHQLPAVIHAFTLGAFVNGFYALQPAVWSRLYGRPPPWPLLAPLIWGLHQAGVVLMLAGFLRAGLAVTYVGAHYLIPTGMVLHAGQGALALHRRAPGTSRHLGCHAPALGMLVAMALGAMIILDEATGRYGLYTPPTLLIHGMSGAFLFLLPALRLHGAVHAAEPGDTAALQRATTGLLLRTVPLGLAVMMIAFGVMPGGPGIALPGGLALLGAALIWGAFPVTPGHDVGAACWMRVTWGVPGLLILLAAMRTLRGMEAAEAFLLARYGAVAVVLVAGLPELSTWLASPLAAAPAGSSLRMRVGAALMAGSGLVILAGQGFDATLAIQGGAAGALGGLVLTALGRGRKQQPPHN